MIKTLVCIASLLTCATAQANLYFDIPDSASEAVVDTTSVAYITDYKQPHRRVSLEHGPNLAIYGNPKYYPNLDWAVVKCARDTFTFLSNYYPLDDQGYVAVSKLSTHLNALSLKYEHACYNLYHSKVVRDGKWEMNHLQWNAIIY